MASESKRKLAAIVFTDIVGFTRLSAENEPAALELLDKQRELLQPIVHSYRGEWLKEIGDGLLLTFETNLDAVECAVEIQKQVRSVDNLNLRIGIHQGEVVFQGNDVIGDDVNIASRIEPFSASGGIAISGRVNSTLDRDPNYKTIYLGKPQLQGVTQEVKAYCIISHGLPETDLSQVKAKLAPDDKTGFEWTKMSVLGATASIVGILTLAVLGLSGLSADGDEIPSIAILYMKNLGDADDEPWAYGLTEDLIIEMSRLGNIRVASMNSITKYKDSDLSEIDIARELDVGYTLSSSIVRSEGQFNLRCQLQDHNKNLTLFGNKWTESLENASLIVNNLADSLSSKLTYKKSDHELVSETYKADPVAYEYLLKGKYKVRSEGQFNLRCQLQDHNKNLTLFGNKWTESLENASLIVNNLADSLSSKLTYKKSDHELVSETYKADPVAYEYLLKGKYKVQYQQNSEDWEMAESLLKMSTEIDPNLASSWSLLGWISFRQGKFPEMKKYAKMAIKTGEKTKSYVAVGHAYELVGLHHEYGNNNLDSAAIYYKRFVDVSEKIDYKKGSTDASRHLSNLLIKQGKKDEGLLYMDSSIDIARKYGDKHELALILPNYADLLLEDGQIEQAISILEEADGLAQKYKKQVAAQSVAGIYSDYYTSIGDLENAYRYTIKAFRIAEELNQELISFGSYVRMCESHFYSGRIDSTFFYLEKITTLTEQLQIPFMVLLSNYYSGRYHFYNGDHNSSVEHFNFLIENIPDDFDLSMRVVPKAFNSINYKNMGQPKRSLEYIDMIKNEIGKDDKFEEMEYYNILIQALEENNEQDLAKKYLLDAYDIIMQRSFKIKDRQLRNDFLEKNYWNLKILTSYNNLAS